MKLFVWVNPYRVSYGNSLLMVVAENVEDARTLAQSKAAKWYSYGKFPNGSPSYHNYGQPGMEENWSREEYDWKLGDPLRVVDLPCAEWHEWSE